MQIITGAGIQGGLIHWEQPMQHVWYDALHLARGQDKLAALIERARKHPGAGQAVATRIDELLAAAPVVEAAPSRRGVGRGFAWHGEAEAITGDRDTMLDVAFLRLGNERASAVVRLLIRFAGVTSCGTGFLIAPDLVLTNHHVLRNNVHEGVPPDMVEAWFNYERGPDGSDRAVHAVSALPDTIQGDAEFDWAVIRLSRAAAADVTPLALRPTLPLGVDDRVYIIQHPAGGPKKVGMHHNEVRYIDTDVVQYLTDTLPGSSGAPVFNERWEVVALHHWSLDGRTDAGRREIRNQGICIERVVSGLMRKGIM